MDKHKALPGGPTPAGRAVANITALFMEPIPAESRLQRCPLGPGPAERLPGRDAPSGTRRRGRAAAAIRPASYAPSHAPTDLLPFLHSALSLANVIRGLPSLTNPDAG